LSGRAGRGSLPPAGRGLVNPAFSRCRPLGLRFAPVFVFLTRSTWFLTRFCFLLLRLLSGFDSRLSSQPLCLLFLFPAFVPYCFEFPIGEFEAKEKEPINPNQSISQGCSVLVNEEIQDAD